MNHGVIEKITVPDGFDAVEIPEEERQNNYFEYTARGSMARICYEETDYPLSEDDRQLLGKLFQEDLTEESPSRRLKLGFDAEGNEESASDQAAYFALCQSFVFGGRLVRGGACIDEERSSWETRRVGAGDRARTVIAANLHFHGPDGSRVKDRQARLVMPVTPGEGGTGYLWLEGSPKEIEKFETTFLDSVVGAGTFRELAASLT